MRLDVTLVLVDHRRPVMQRNFSSKWIRVHWLPMTWIVAGVAARRGVAPSLGRDRVTSDNGQAACDRLVRCDLCGSKPGQFCLDKDGSKTSNHKYRFNRNCTHNAGHLGQLVERITRWPGQHS